VSAAATQERQKVLPGPVDVLDRRQIEIESAIAAYRVGGAPGLFQLGDPRSREIALELQADTPATAMCRRLEGAPTEMVAPVMKIARRLRRNSRPVEGLRVTGAVAFLFAGLNAWLLLQTVRDWLG